MSEQHLHSIIRAKDSQIKEREQVIKRLQMQINSLQNCYTNTLTQFHGNYPSSASESSVATGLVNFGEHTLDQAQGDGLSGSPSKISNQAELLLKNSEIEKLKEKITGWFGTK